VDGGITTGICCPRLTQYGRFILDRWTGGAGEDVASTSTSIHGLYDVLELVGTPEEGVDVPVVNAPCGFEAGVPVPVESEYTYSGPLVIPAAAGPVLPKYGWVSEKLPTNPTTAMYSWPAVKATGEARAM
jgi:hypothetical protein